MIPFDTKSPINSDRFDQVFAVLRSIKQQYKERFTLDHFMDSYLYSDMEMFLPLTADALDISGNGNNGTATDIIYSDKPDMKMYLPLVSDALDDSDFGNDGTATDITWTGGVANFNGVSSFIEIDNFYDFTESYEINFKFKVSSFPAVTGCVLFESWNASGYNYGVPCISIEGSDIYFKIRNDGGGDIAILYTPISLNTEYFVSAIYDKTAGAYGSIFLSLNNGNIVVQVLGSLPINYTNKYRIGRSLSSTWLLDYFSGTISNFRLFNGALTDAERTRLYTENVFLPLPQPVAVFNGASSRINVQLTFLSFLSSCFSFKSIIDAPSVSGTYLIKVAAGGKLFRVDADATGFFIPVIINTGVEYSIGSNWVIPTDGAEHKYIIQIIDQYNIEMYIDNISQGIKTFSVEPIYNFTLSDFDIGQGDFEGLSGTMSDLILINRALTDAEGTSIYNNNLKDVLDTSKPNADGFHRQITLSEYNEYDNMGVTLYKDPTFVNNDSGILYMKVINGQLRLVFKNETTTVVIR